MKPAGLVHNCDPHAVAYWDEIRKRPLDLSRIPDRSSEVSISVPRFLLLDVQTFVSQKMSERAIMKEKE